jgi:hypothetical protein
LSIVSRQPQWRLIADAIQCLIERQSDADRQMMERIATRRVAKATRSAKAARLAVARRAKAEGRRAKVRAR